MTSLRIAVTGLAATYPFGGVFWDYVQYPLGLLRLGHDVLYIEDTGKWCYNPDVETFVEDGSRNAARLAANLARLDPRLADRWFYRDARSVTYGRSWSDVVRFCASADLFIHISASCWMREEYFAADRLAFIDSDPVYTQASGSAYLARDVDEAARTAGVVRPHDSYFSFGENTGTDGCSVPTLGLDWMPTRQPIVTGCFESEIVPPSQRRVVASTIASWNPAEDGPTVGGVAYYDKVPEFERFIDLPSLASLPLEIAFSGPVPAARFRRHGWTITDGFTASQDPWVYRRYLATSFAEWSVAKQAYVASNSGWFSCRTACYLALGVPAVVQDTGFSAVLPTGEGLIAFDTLDAAAAGLEDIKRDPAGHSRRAVEIAAEYFDSDRVLTSLVERAGSG